MAQQLSPDQISDHGAPVVEWPETVNLGCGRRKIASAWNVDLTSDTEPDMVHDLNLRPWPLPNKVFSEVLAFDVVEHLRDVVGVMEEIHRISKTGARVKITVPHFSCANAFTDPTHLHYFGWHSCWYFTGENEWSFYTRARFRRVRSEIIFQPSLVNKIVWRLANRWPKQYEHRWAWMFPAWYLYFELEVVA
jgi:SAM-dependent methyltransferase